MRKLLTLAVLLLIGLQIGYAQLTTISGPNTVQTGDYACYDFPITWSSTTENLINGKIEIILPAPLSDSPSDVNFNTPPFVSSSSYNQTTRTITWNLESPFFAGSSANLHFCTKFLNGSTPNGTMVTLSPTLTRTGGAAQSISTTLSATATTKVKITKTIAKNPALNNDAVFFIRVENPNESGNLDLTNVEITDPLPTGVNFVSANNGGSLVGSNVKWTIPSLPVGTTKVLRLTVQYMAPFTQGSTSTNTATLIANQIASPGISASKDITISAPDPSGSFSKSPFAPCPSLGGVAGWNIGVQNAGNVPLTNVVVEDMLPPEFFLNNALTVTADPEGNPATVTVEYQTVANPSYTNWGTLTFPANPATPTDQSLSAPAGSPITKVRLTWNSIGVGYSSGVSMSGIVNSPDKLGGTFSAGPTTATGKQITNMITNNFMFNGNPQPQVTVNADLTIVAQLPKPVVSKSLLSNYNQEPGNEVDYQLCIANAADGVGNLVDPIIADLLPVDVEYVANSISNVSGPLGTPTLTQSVNTASSRPLLKFTWPLGSSLPIGQNTCFNIKVKVKAGAPAGVRSNKLFFLPTTTLNLCDNQQQLADGLDIDGDGNTTEIMPSTNNIDFNVIQIAAVSSSKWVKGLCDADFHRFPDVGKTTSYTEPGTGTFQYKMIIQNLGNEPLKDIKIMDILPFIGDVGVITINNTRNTTYLPVFVSMDVVPTGITPKYSTTNNPVRTDLDATLSSPSGAVAGNFSTTIPSNLADIKSILFDFGSIVMQPGETKEIFMTMRVPYGVGPTDIAWNSFGHRTDILPSAMVPKPIPAEPIKVGIQVKAAKIGNYVWVDSNRNGKQDDGNTGLPNVTVRLLDNAGAPIINPETNQPVTTVTDNTGFYCFGVTPGTYMVKFDIPAAYSPTTKDSAADNEDSDIDQTGKTASVTVAEGDENLTLDAGVINCGTGTIGDKIWKDLNDNGIQDGGLEVGVDGITLNLYASDANGNKVGASIASQTTANGGIYQFVEVGRGDYVIEIDKNQILAMGMQLSQKLNQTNDDNDNDFIYASGLTEKFSIDPCAEGEKDITNIDGALASLGSIGDKIWKDFNNDGIQNNNEVGVDGVTLKLFLADANGNPIGGAIQTKTTANGGMYKFENLLEGMYVVQVDITTIMSPMELSLKPNNTNDDTDSDFNPTTGFSPKITVVPSNPTQKDITNVDGGIVTLGSIGDKVWKDYNNNGVQDSSPNEAGVDGITMNLYLADANGNKTGGILQTKVTAGGGMYKFSQLDEGMYVVELITSTIMAPMELSLKPNATNDDSDSDFNPTNGLSPKITVIPNDPTQKDITNVDAGIVTLGSIGDKVWKDYNNNGVQDSSPNEAGVDGITMNLYLADANGNKTGGILQTKVTAGGGMYKFSQLDEGMYVVELITSTIMAPMELSLKPNATNDNSDSDFNPTSGLSPKITVIPNDPTQKDITNVDAGIVTLGSIGDKIWKDSNNNGIQDNTEFGVGGVDLELYLADNQGNPTGAAIKTTSTDGNGMYRFRQLDEGMYFVKIIKSSIMATMEISKKKDLGGDDTKDNDLDRFSGYSHKVTVIPNDPAQKDILTVDGAIRNRIRGSIGDFVWKDLIENGLQESCEKGVPNVTMEIYMKNPQTGILGKLDTITGVFTPNVPQATTTTNASGKYLFTKLEDETYVVKVVAASLMANMEISPLQNAGADNIDHDFNATTGLADQTVLDPYIPALRNILTVDAAIRNTPCNTLTSEAAAFSGTGNSATGALTVGNSNVGLNVSASNTQILRSSQDRASTLFGDNCYTTKPTSGGYMTFRDDSNGSGLVTINFGKVVSNPILYFKDIARRKLDLSTSVDANGNPICMRKISGNGDVQMNEMMMMIQDNNPAQIGALKEPISQSCGLVQMIGDFSSIKIQSTALNGAADNWSFGIASEDYHCGIHPEIMPLMAKKKVANIVPKDPANPAGNKIVTFQVELENKTSKKYNNLFIENYLDEKWGNAIVAVSAPVITWPINARIIQPNPSFNGTSDVSLLSKTNDNMMNGGEVVRIEYTVELNPALIDPAARHENRLIVGSTSMPVFLPNFEECNLPVYLPLTTQLPTNPVVEIAGGSAEVDFATWLQCFGKSMVAPHPQCGKITWGYEMCEKPFTVDCGNTGTHHTLFKGMDECGNMYMWRADFKSEDKSKPVWDMLPMDKSINCDDSDAATALTMWLNSGGGAWFSDPGTPNKPKVSSDFNGVAPSCTGGPRTITFTITDQCGNISTAKAQLSISDNKAPSIKNVDTDLTIDCGTTYTFSTPTAEDNCGNAALTFVDSGSDDCTKDNKKTRTWTATDGCGNTATASQTVYFLSKANALKMTNVISDKIITCNEPVIFDTPKFESNCSNAKISSSFTDEKTNGGCQSEIEITRHWMFWNQCGNTYEVNQTISIMDNEPPVFVSNLPKAFTMKKSVFNVWKKLYFANYVKANDNCSAVTMSAPIFKVLSSKTAECTVVANDQCGNLAKYTCIVNFEDLSATSKEASVEDSRAEAIIKELEAYVTDETPIDVPIEAVIYPNPTSRVVNVVPATGYGEIQKIHIYNLSGQVLLNMDVEGNKSQIITIDISNFANATYIIEMVHPTKKLYRQVQKIQ